MHTTEHGAPPAAAATGHGPSALPPNVLPFRRMDGRQYSSAFERWASTDDAGITLRADGPRIQVSLTLDSVHVSLTFTAAEAAGLGAELINAACFAHNHAGQG